MMDKPLVSIITVTRNRGKLLRRCIKSILSQTYTNIEYIVVDGASTDETDYVVASFKDNRLHYVKLDYNWPLKETSDYAISLCKGEYISFLDSDDEYLPEKIEKQVKLIESLPKDYGMVYCWMSYFDESSKQFLYTHKAELRGFVGGDVVEKPTVSGTPTLLFRSEALKESGGWKTKEEIGIITDWELCARFCQKWKVDYVPESLVKVYINHGYPRMSGDEGKEYYNDAYNRTIKLHCYFLEEFKSIFDRDPQKKKYHIENICYCAKKQNKFKLIVWCFFMDFMIDPRWSKLIPLKKTTRRIICNIVRRY